MTTRAAPEDLVNVAPAAAAAELSAPSHATAPADHAAVRAIVAGIMLAMFLSALEQTIVAPALPAIGRSLGGGGLLPIAQTIIADLLSPRERPVVQGRTSIMFMSASILGPVLGGFLTDQLHWSLIFWINLPLGAVALVMSERALRQLPRNDRPHELDVIGAALMVGAALALMLALAWGGIRYPWGSWRIITLVASSGALWVLFTLRLLTAREPFIPLAILHGRVTSTITVAAFF